MENAKSHQQCQQPVQRAKPAGSTQFTPNEVQQTAAHISDSSLPGAAPLGSSAQNTSTVVQLLHEHDSPPIQQKHTLQRQRGKVLCVADCRITYCFMS